MDKKKGIVIAILLFLLIGLGTFVFANPSEDSLNGGNNSSSNETNNNEENLDESNTEDTTEKEDNKKPVVNNTGGNTSNVAVDDSYDKALEAVVKAEDSFTQADLDAAKELVNNVTNTEDKAALAERLENLQNVIDVDALVKELTTMVNEAASKKDMDSSREFKTEEEIAEKVAELTEGAKKEELKTALAVLDKLLNDTTSPVVEGLTDGEHTNEELDVTLKDDTELTLLLNEEEVSLTDLLALTKEGTYKLVVRDEAYNETPVTFTIDTTSPEISDADELTKEDVSIKVTDKNLKEVTVNGEKQELVYDEENEVYTFTATYKTDDVYEIVATDKAGNSNDVTFEIDKTKPVIEGVKDGEYYGLNDTVKITVDDKNPGTLHLKRDRKIIKNYKFGTELTQEGAYTVYMSDKAGNKSGTITFEIDRTLPEITDIISVYETKSNGRIKYTITTSEEIFGSLVNKDNWRKTGENTYVNYYFRTKDVVFTFEDIAGNENTYSFRVDLDAPVVTGVEEGILYADGATPVVTDENLDTVTLNGKDFVSGTKITEKGDYTLVATDKNGMSTTVSFRVGKYDTKLVLTVPSNPVYDGNKKEATAVLYDEDDNVLNENVSIKYYNSNDEEVEPINGGTYKVVAKYAGNDTYEASSKEDTMTISKANTEIVLTAPNSVVYDGEAKEYSATLYNEYGQELNETIKVVYEAADGSRGDAINAGTYTVIAHFAGNENYNGTYIRETFSIVKANTEFEFTAPTVEELVYSATAKEYDVRLMTSYNEELNVTYTVVYEAADGSRGDAINAGTYTVIAHFAGDENHNGTYKRETFEITKATPTIELIEPSLVYNGEAQEFGIKVIGADGKEIAEPNMNVVYEYNENGVRVTKKDAPVNAGEYRIGIHVRANQNYTVANLWKPFTVEKAKPTVEITEPSLIYNGEKQEYGIKVIGINGTEIIDPSMNVVYKDRATGETLTEAPTNAGSYTLGIYVRPSENYTRGDLWLDFDVLQATPIINLIAPNLMYDQLEKVYGIEVIGVDGNVIANPSMNVIYKNTETGETLTDVPKHVGSYQIAVYVRPTQNYTSKYASEKFTIYDGNSPVVSGVENNKTYDKVTITATDDVTASNELVATIDGNAYVLGTEYSIAGNHTLIVKDAAGNDTTIAFTIAETVLANDNKTSTTVFGTPVKKTSVKEFYIVDHTNVPNGVESWDVSSKKDGSVMAWVIDDKLYVGQEGGVKAPADSSYLFYGYENIEKIDVSNLNTEDVTNMSYMFGAPTGNYKTPVKEIVGLDKWDTSKVTDMSYMFKRVTNIKTLDLSNFDTSNVTNMSNMFNGASSLTTLNITSFDTSKVTNMSSMFSSCSSLTTLDLSSFDTSNVTDMSSMFSWVDNIKNLDLSNFNTTKVKTMRNMFQWARYIETVDLSSFDTTNTTDLYGMFQTATKMVATLTVRNANSKMGGFNLTAKESGAQITLNYTKDTESIVDKVIADKDSNSNIVKGILVD